MQPRWRVCERVCVCRWGPSQHAQSVLRPKLSKIEACRTKSLHLRMRFHLAESQPPDEKLQHSVLDKASERTDPVLRAGARRFQKAHERLDMPDLSFKVAVCMYALGQGGPLKVLADVASIGESTLRRYLHLFVQAVISHIKPIYMPGQPFSSEDRAAVQGQFASRRGLPNVTLACDGSHVPFKPKSKKVAMEYRNYKGWTSILTVELTVAFVDSFYRFFEVHVGYPGRAGDNTVLSRMRFMDDIKADPDRWLGPGGVR